MQRTLSRGSVGALLILCVAAGAVAQPPSPSALDKLRADTTALATERANAESSSAERAKLTNDLRNLLERLKDAPPTKGPTSPTGPMNPMNPPKKSTEIVPGIGSVPVDRLRAAMNLVRDGQTNAALNAFRQLNLQELAPDDRAFAKYMTAACLRQLGRTAEAFPIYRDVSDSNEDPFIASSAVSQMALLRSSEALQAQLAKLLERPKSR